MKTEETPLNDIKVVYRTDGKTPDLRYKSLREHVLSQHMEKIGKTPVQIKPAGKKPVWRLSREKG